MYLAFSRSATSAHLSLLLVPQNTLLGGITTVCHMCSHCCSQRRTLSELFTQSSEECRHVPASQSFLFFPVSLLFPSYCPPVSSVLPSFRLRHRHALCPFMSLNSTLSSCRAVFGYQQQDELLSQPASQSAQPQSLPSSTDPNPLAKQLTLIVLAKGGGGVEALKQALPADKVCGRRKTEQKQEKQAVTHATN